MHILGRQVRFSVKPFASEQRADNVYVSTPINEGLSFYLELSVKIKGSVNPDTGFVVNVVDIDRIVLKEAFPIFSKRLSDNFKSGRDTGYSELVELLGLTWCALSGRFDGARLSELSLNLNPFRKMTIDSKEFEMVYYSEKFEFSAAHKLWNDKFSKEENFEAFGKCANPNGHGHNYTVEVTVKSPAGKGGFSIGGFEKIVDDELIKILDHKNLNEDLEFFTKAIPTVENIAIFAWDRLIGRLDQIKLHCVTIWETERTYCSYYGL